MGLKLLFICTGNTCRSPMAEGLARKLFGDIAQISSAGMAALEGDEISPNALVVLNEQNIDLSEHRARRVNDQLVAEADWIIPMTKMQEEMLKRLYPHYQHKTCCLGYWGKPPRDIIDPWMGSVDVYRQTAQEINELLRALKEKLKAEE